MSFDYELFHSRYEPTMDEPKLRFHDPFFGQELEHITESGQELLAPTHRNTLIVETNVSPPPPPPQERATPKTASAWPLHPQTIHQSPFATKSLTPRSAAAAPLSNRTKLIDSELGKWLLNRARSYPLRGLPSHRIVKAKK